MITPEQDAHIVRLYHAEKWPPGTIASQLGLHHSVVERVLSTHGIPRAGLARSSIVDPYLPFILATLKKYPELHASRLWHMVKERGYPGRPGHFRSIIARYRPAPPAQAYLRLRTLPGEQAQVDWGHFGKVVIGKATRPLVAFVMVLSWSRAIFLRFYLAQHISNFLRGHEAAFAMFGGVPRVLLYDNLKSAVLERVGDAIRFNPVLLDFSAHYLYEPRPVAIARGNEKGRVERSIGYTRSAFFAARAWRDLDDLNRQADEWTRAEAMERRWPDDPSVTVAEAFIGERQKLLGLPPNPFPTAERVETKPLKTPYVRFDLNDYSVPHDCVRQDLVVMADLEWVRILRGADVVAMHRRSFDRGVEIEDPRHIEALVQAKRRGRKHRGVDRLANAAPECLKLLDELAQRGANLGSAVTALLRLLDTHGAQELQAAAAEALARGVPHPHAVRHALERSREVQGKPPALPLALPNDPHVRELTVRIHSLASYDKITKENHDAQGNRHDAAQPHATP